MVSMRTMTNRLNVPVSTDGLDRYRAAAGREPLAAWARRQLDAAAAPVESERDIVRLAVQVARDASAAPEHRMQAIEFLAARVGAPVQPAAEVDPDQERAA